MDGWQGEWPPAEQVPLDLIVAGAPHDPSAWPDELSQAYFSVTQEGEDWGGDPPDALTVTDLPTDLSEGAFE